MNTVSKIRTALVTAFIDAALIESAQVCWENRPFKPVSNLPFVAVHFLPASATAFSCGQQGLDKHDGILQFSLKFPISADGENDIMALYEQIAEIYIAGRSFTYDDTSAFVKNCARTRAQNIEGYHTIYVNINWQGYLTRKAF